MAHEDDRTVEQLQDELRKQGKPVSGSKDELVARLNEDDKPAKSSGPRSARRKKLTDDPEYGPTKAGHPFPTGADRTGEDVRPEPVSPGAARGTKYEKNFDYSGPEDEPQ